MRYKFQADWQPYAFDESNAFLTSDQAVESILSPVDTTKFPFTSSGIPLRVVDNCAYVNNNTENTIIFGETDSMKTRSAVRPLIAMAAGAHESMVVTDVKGELASDAKLRKFLEMLGYRTVFMDFRTCASDGYNVLEYPFRLYCNGLHDKAMACVASLISALTDKYNGTNADPFWDIMSSEHLMPIIQILFEVCSQKKEYHQYVNMLTLSAFTNEEATLHLNTLVETYMSGNSSGVINMLRSVLSAPEKTRASIVAINSPGGSVTAALSIVDTMQRLKQEIITVCTGIAASAAAVITACGTRRYITPLAEMMIHQPLGRAAGQAVDIELTAAHIAKVKQRLHALLAEHTKQSIEIIASDCDRDFYLDAHEAVRYGLVDEILYEPLTATSSTT